MGRAQLIQLAKALVHVGDLITPAIILDIITSDPDDPRILACAVVGRVHVIVSGDLDLRRLSAYDGITIAAPRDFMRRPGMPEHP
jgi:predicted nucleic acid-binding protein